MKILVTYGSQRGGTTEIAVKIAAVLRSAGHETDVLAGHEVRALGAYGAVVVGGALYAMRWHADARRFVLRHFKALRERPVWFFSSGPLDDSARATVIPPTASVQQLVDYVGARGHVTFGGRLAPDARGFVASSMARTHAGDWRDMAAVGQWADEVAEALRSPATLAQTARSFKPLPSRVEPVGLGLMVGVSALLGGGALVARPDGSLLGLPLSVLAHTPFRDFMIPGLLLLVAVGGINLWAVFLQWIRSDFASLASLLGGATLVVWIVVEAILLRGVQALHLVSLVFGLAIVALATRQVRAALPPADPSHPTPSRG